MTLDKVREACQKMWDQLGAYQPREFSHYEKLYNYDDTHVSVAADYAKALLIRIQPIIDEGNVDKSMRWLGFIQGALWAVGFYSIDELKEMNKPTV